MLGEQDFASRPPSLRLTARVKDDLERASRSGAFVQRAGKIGRQCPGEKLDLLVPIRSALDRGNYLFSGHPYDGTSPFSRKGTRTASSLTKSSCVSSTLNPRPRRASIMWES